MPELGGIIQEFLEGSIKSIGGRTPVLNHISIYENGEYTPPTGVDGYDNIVVDVPSKEEVSGTFTENGTYTPPANKVYNEVVVNVPTPSPVLNHISIFENGEYTPPTGVDGYDNIVVDVPIKSEVSATFTENGTYTPPANKVYNEVVVAVPSYQHVYKSNDDKIIVIVDDFTGLTFIMVYGLYINQRFYFSDIDNADVKNILMNLALSTLVAKSYDSMGGTYDSNMVIDISGKAFVLYSTNFGAYLSGSKYALFVNMTMTYDGVNQLYLQNTTPHLPS